MRGSRSPDPFRAIGVFRGALPDVHRTSGWMGFENPGLNSGPGLFPILLRAKALGFRMFSAIPFSLMEKGTKGDEVVSKKKPAGGKRFC